MKAYTCFLLLFAYTNSSVLNTPKEDNSNLELKVILEINIKENSNNTFKPTNETVIDENKIPRPDFRASTVETLTDFIQGVANILNTYEDTAFEDFFDILDEEIRKYHYRGCKFYELTENYEFRRIMAEKLDLFKIKSVPILKAEINELADIIKHETYNNNVKKLLDYINSLYRGDAREKFGKILSDLKAYDNSTSKRPKNELIKIIKDGVRAIVFNHYTDLNINARRELKKEIATFLKKIKEAPSSTPKTNLFPYKPALRKSKDTVNIYGYNIANKDKNPEHHPKIDPISTNKTNVLKLNTSEEKHQQEATNLKEENISQQLQITYLSSDESSDETIEGSSIEFSQERQQEFNSQTYATLNTEEVNKNTENSEIIYKSDLKSKLVQRMLIEESSSRLPTVQPTTTPGLRFLSDEDLRRSMLPPLPEEELSIDVFDREERKRQKSLANRNRITTKQHGIKNYIKRMRNLQKEIKQLKKIDYYNRNSRVNVISNGDKKKTKKKEKKEKTSKNKNKKSKDKKHKDKNKRMESKKTERTKHVDERQSAEYEGRAQTETSKNETRETKRDVKITNSVNEDVKDLESDTEIVKNYDSQAYKLKKQKQKKKKVTRNKSTKATKTDEKHKATTDAMASVNIRVRRSLKQLAPAKNNAGNTTVNNNPMKLIKTAIKVTKKVSSATLNVTEEVKPKTIKKKTNDKYITKANATRRHRRVLEFSSPPLYDQPFFKDHTFWEGIPIA